MSSIDWNQLEDCWIFAVGLSSAGQQPIGTPAPVIAFYDWSAAPFLISISVRGFSRSVRTLFCLPLASLPRLIAYAPCFVFLCLTPGSSTSSARAPTVHPSTMSPSFNGSSLGTASLRVRGSCCEVSCGNRRNSEFLVRFTRQFSGPNSR